KVATPTSPDLGSQRTAGSSDARLLYPVQGNIIRAYSTKSDGIDIAAKAGAPVKAADAGTVAAILQSVDQVPILVIRHSGNLLTVYANVEGVKLKKGDRVKRGQIIGKVISGNPAFVHFEVRKGPESVDPMPYLK
ncbi:MAG: M23 family metallopeptidase, partial [Marinosulfonomonas sp.]|nr:M23 family metallopeptidase [Marinosulfonomonas sp.]